MAMLTTPSMADTDELSAQPAKCIALRKGQVCYQTITLRWQTEKPGDYCLWVDNNIEPIECWSTTDRGSVRYKFASKKTARFHLKSDSSENPVANTEVVVAWVYKSRAAGRPRWRLF